MGGINLAISLGASKDESHAQSSASTARGSTVAAGGNVNLTATGGGVASNIVVQGSDIKAGVNATLKADNEVRLESAYPYIGLAMAYAKTDEQKAYVKQLLAEQENDLVAQFPRLEALGAQASLLDHLLVELATTIDNPAAVVSSLNSLREKIANVRDKAASKVNKSTGGGRWIPVNESMSDRARAYQEQITGRSGQAYLVNKVKFDGVKSDGTLQDAKGPGYEKFVGKNGRFEPWYEGKEALIDQAARQINAAKGIRTMALRW
nr:hemagglutinin repeat-containing protein [Herbaspirillum sp. B39]